MNEGASLPGTTEVDWIRVYQKDPDYVPPLLPEDETLIPEAEWPTEDADDKLESWNFVYEEQFANLDVARWTTGTGWGATTWSDKATTDTDGLVLGLTERETDKYDGTKVISTQKFKYGKVVVRAKLGQGNGQFFTLQMLADVGDSISFQMKKVGGNFAFDDPTGTITAGTDFTSYNLYEIEWDEVGIKFFVNGTQISSKTGGTNAEGYSLTLSYWMGIWGGMDDPTALPGTSHVDWVKFYTKK